MTHPPSRDLLCVNRAWLLTDVSTLSILDKVVLDRFLWLLAHNMKRAATLEVLLEAVETHQHTEALMSGSRAELGARPSGQDDSPTAVYPKPTVGRALHPLRDGWGRANLPPTTPGTWGPMEVF